MCRGQIVVPSSGSVSTCWVVVLIIDYKKNTVMTAKSVEITGLHSRAAADARG